MIYYQNSRRILEENSCMLFTGDILLAILFTGDIIGWRYFAWRYFFRTPLVLLYVPRKSVNLYEIFKLKSNTNLHILSYIKHIFLILSL